NQHPCRRRLLLRPAVLERPFTAPHRIPKPQPHRIKSRIRGRIRRRRTRRLTALAVIHRLRTHLRLLPLHRPRLSQIGSERTVRRNHTHISSFVVDHSGAPFPLPHDRFIFVSASARNVTPSAS